MKILIVDDSATNLKLLRAILESEGIEVIEAGDGLAALEMLEREEVDGVISDILMPRMDGYRLCLEVRKTRKISGLPFVAYTSTYTSAEDERTARHLGADGFIKKPAPPGELLRTLREAVTAAKTRTKRAANSQEELGQLEEYSGRLVAKLEERNTELEAQTEVLLQNERQLMLQATALEMAANAIVISDREGKILWVNPAFTRLSGYSPKETIGQTPRLLKSGKHGPAYYQKLWETILSGRTWHGEFVNRRKDGTLFHGEQTVTPVYAEPGKITHFIGIMQDISERKRTEEEARRSREQLRALAARLQDAREEERIRISRDIHDHLGEMLTGVKLGLGWIRVMLEREGEELPRAALLEKIAAIGSLANDTAGRVRKLCTELRPAVLDDLGLVPAIEWQAREFQTRTNIRCETQFGVEHVACNPDQATAIFRIFQEILTNVGRHAEASTVEVRFNASGLELVLEVQDNGKGIAPERLAGTGSLGLLGMQERAQLLGGRVEISGPPGKGTLVKVIVPLGRAGKPARKLPDFNQSETRKQGHGQNHTT